MKHVCVGSCVGLARSRPAGVLKRCCSCSGALPFSGASSLRKAFTLTDFLGEGDDRGWDGGMASSTQLT